MLQEDSLECAVRGTNNLPSVGRNSSFLFRTNLVRIRSITTATDTPLCEVDDCELRKILRPLAVCPHIYFESADGLRTDSSTVVIEPTPTTAALKVNPPQIMAQLERTRALCVAFPLTLSLQPWILPWPSFHILPRKVHYGPLFSSPMNLTNT
jgi:hypothetical protein